MKRGIFIAIIILFALNTNAQKTEPQDQNISVDYLQKSKRQKTTGFILLGGGAAMITGGALAMQSTIDKGETEALIILGGLAMSIASIPFFISSGSNKRKAKLYMKKETLMLTPNINTGVAYTSIGMRVNL